MSDSRFDMQVLKKMNPRSLTTVEKFEKMRKAQKNTATFNCFANFFLENAEKYKKSTCNNRKYML